MVDDIVPQENMIHSSKQHNDGAMLEILGLGMAPAIYSPLLLNYSTVCVQSNMTSMPTTRTPLDQ